MGSESDSIEEKSAARKEALRALRAAQELSESKEEGDGDVAVEEDGPAMKFRNYLHHWSYPSSKIRLLHFHLQWRRKRTRL
ncbi:BnaC03g34100D [Brassica napus]|uniref:BnaC03g34100D protein n=1 Tax=Brassica napus TaxID=3708 RepID=A0A078HTP3_BRANA|nr:BnaC03g34100D [Brassica napus]